jgi:serine/threonine-protein kinase
MRLPIASAITPVEPAPRGERVDRTAGENALVNADKTRSDGPAIACGAGACYLVWHGDAPTGGASAAYIDPAKAQPLWRKKFAKVGMHPAVAVASDGHAQLVWYEGGRVATASISRDGIGPATRFARVSGDQPMPSIAPGAKTGEWYIAWLDYEAGHLEPYAARVLCR